SVMKRNFTTPRIAALQQQKAGNAGRDQIVGIDVTSPKDPLPGNQSIFENCDGIPFVIATTQGTIIGRTAGVVRLTADEGQARSRDRQSKHYRVLGFVLPARHVGRDQYL